MPLYHDYDHYHDGDDNLDTMSVNFVFARFSFLCKDFIPENLFIDSKRIVVKKWGVASQHLIKEDPKCPPEEFISTDLYNSLFIEGCKSLAKLWTFRYVSTYCMYTYIYI